MKKKLTVITQNLNKKPEQEISKYFNEFKADIYAFQELKRKKSCITEIFTRPEFASSCKETYCGHEDERRLSNLLFPWLEFRSGYWMEKHIMYGGKEIIVINIHCSPRYSSEQRFILLKRLDELEDKNVILLGDFNAAFAYQTEKNIPENDVYLRIITEKGYLFLKCANRAKIKNQHILSYINFKRRSLIMFSFLQVFYLQ